VQVPSGDRAKFRRFLAKTGYPFVDETQNPAFRLFLAG
jgi:threonine dehydratase